MAEGEEAVPGTESQVDEQEEAVRRLQAEIERLTVADHLLLMMQSLSALAMNRLGLTEETAGRKDPDQARLAIDAFKALVGVIEGTRPPAEITAHRAVLSQLQLAYVAALTPAGAAEEGEASPEAAAEGGS